MNRQHDRHYSVAEAQAMVIDVRAAVARMAELALALRTRGYDIYRHQYFGGMGPNGQGAFPQELEELVTILRALDDRGIQVKDVETGLIDFPHVRANGEEVYLCYRLGEAAIGFWHPLEGGFAAREPLATL